MSLIDHAKRELHFAELDSKDSDYDGMIANSVIELINVFAKQGHSGYSAMLTLRVFNEIAKFKPLTPLTGEDSEWINVSENLWQNVRHSSVFKDENGNAWDIDGKILINPDGSYKSEKTNILFPYSPSVEKIYVKSTEIV